MRLAEYRERLTQPLRKATLCFLRRDNEVLLAMKKRGFGEGRWNGVGGKPRPKEAIEEAARREAREEVCVLPSGLTRIATLDFYFLHNPDWNQRVLVYTSENWEGEPAETEEMRPRWFSINELPLEDMWPDDEHWLPRVLEGKKLKGEFLFGPEDIILDFQINEIEEQN